MTSGANHGNQSPHWVLSSYRLACYQSNTQQGSATSLQVPATCWQPQTYSVCSVVSSHLPVGSEMLGRSLGLRPPQWFHTGTHHKTGYFSFLVSLFKKASSCLSVCSSVQMTLLPWTGLRRKKSCIIQWDQYQLKTPENRLVISAATIICGQAGRMPLHSRDWATFPPKEDTPRSSLETPVQSSMRRFSAASAKPGSLHWQCMLWSTPAEVQHSVI